MERQNSVLIIDPSLESREVLRTVLERRGLRILEASRAEDGLRLARAHHPEVIVLDAESVPASGREMKAAFAEESRNSHATLVILGRIPGEGVLPVPNCVLAKPYHYGALVRTIEQFAVQGVQNGVAVCDPRARPGQAIRAS